MSSTESRGPGLGGPADERPLTEEEFRLLQRLLGDPFSFPIQFKTWLVSYLETSDLNLPMSAISGLTAVLGITGVGKGTLGVLPAGMIFPYGGDVAPAGSLLCDGASYLRSAYDRLYAAIGTRFGSVDVNTFNVPDIRERLPVGKGTQTAVDTVGKSEGMPLGQRGPYHAHQVRDPGHVHGSNYSYVGTGGNVQDPGAGTNYNTNSNTAPATTGIGVGPAGGVPTDTPGFITLNFI